MLHVFFAAATSSLIVVTNWVLFRHLITITGERDVRVEIPAAIVRSAMLLFALISLYDGLYFLEISQAYGDYRMLAFLPRAVHETVRWLYFSTVTFATVGYGDLSPGGSLSGELTASAEALNGLIAFGVFTGALTGYLSRKPMSDEPLTDRENDSHDGRKAGDDA